jgi:lipid-A-disaccharide synthase
MDREIVKELIQNELNTTNLKHELTRILSGDKRQKMLEDFRDLKSLLGSGGASARAAQIVFESFK